MCRTFHLECHQMRLTFVENEDLDGFGYQLFVKDEGDWRPISAPMNPLVRGKSFDLFPSKIQPEKNGSVLSASGIKKWITRTGDLCEYSWTACIEADLERGWFRISVEVNNPNELPLRMEDGYEPEITLDLGLLPPYERGDHIWFKTNVNNPTLWGDDQAYGNDFPATYYFDPYQHYELMMFFDLSSMSWMSYDNIARFLNYRCGFRRRYRPDPAAEIGLYADGFSGKIFPRGPQHFDYWITARPRGDGKSSPNERAALSLLVERCLPLLTRESNWPPNATTWKDFSLKSARDMSDSDHCWARNDDGEFMVPYVDCYSPAWEQALAAHGVPYNIKVPSLDVPLWVAWPLWLICATEQTPEYHLLNDRLLKVIDRITCSHKFAMINGRTASYALCGTWQYIYDLAILWQFAMRRDDQDLASAVHREVDTTLIPFAQKFHHIFPLLFDKQDLEQIGTGDNHGAAGLYAYLMVLLYKATGKREYYLEAQSALRVSFHLPFNAALQSILHTAAGANAAAQLYAMTQDIEYEKIYRYLLAQSFRLMYWYTDRDSQLKLSINTMGMFNAATPMNYAAFYEDIETFGFLTPTFKVFKTSPDILNLINQARKHNFSFFPACLPEKYHTSPLKYIPHENIPQLEVPPSTLVGQELYGAGSTFRGYLLWEAFGRCEDRDVMVLNLNSFEEREWLYAETTHLMFLVYNPEPVSKKAQVYFPLAVEHHGLVATGPTPHNLAPVRPLEGEMLNLDLAPYELIYADVTIHP